MARKPRILFPGAFYHVMARGNGGKDIFHSDDDRKYFYKLLVETIKYYGYRIHAFCLMTNHVHIAIQIGNQSLSRIMQNIMSRFAHYINKIVALDIFFKDVTKLFWLTQIPIFYNLFDTFI